MYYSRGVTIHVGPTWTLFTSHYSRIWSNTVLHVFLRRSYTQVVELWTKRNFRCDCGNSNFGVFFCKLFANKDPENMGNLYNHNFKGSYCTCNRPYPDPDAEEQMEMMQCCICEDWFHEHHLGLESSDEVPTDDKDEPLYEDFICQECVVICSFLTLYPQTISVTSKQSDAQLSTSKESNTLSASSFSARVDSGVCSLEPSKTDPSDINTDTKKTLGEKGGSLRELSEKNIGIGGNTSLDSPSICSSGELENAGCSSHSQTDNCSVLYRASSNEVRMEGVLLAEPEMPLYKCSQNANASSKCVLGVLDLQVAPLLLKKVKPLFLSKNWRELLCRCESCIKFYTQKGIGFLIDREDSIVEYEKLAKQKREEKLQQQEGLELSFLNGLGHVQKIEILNGIADMKMSYDPSWCRCLLTHQKQSHLLMSTNSLKIFQRSVVVYFRLFHGSHICHMLALACC